MPMTMAKGNGNSNSNGNIIKRVTTITIMMKAMEKAMAMVI